MNEKVIEKLKDANFFKEVVTIEDEGKVKEMFKKENIEITDKDLKEIGDLIKCSVEVASNLSSEELEKVSAGYKDGVVQALSEKLRDWADGKYSVAPTGSFSETFYYKSRDNSDKVVELGLATVLIGGTIGVQKLIKTGKEKGWWTKDYWIKKK